VQTLSGGERQRLAIATLLAQAPQLYLLDEPLAHLDLNHQIATLELFSALAREREIACVMVLHEPGLAVRFCSHALLLFGDGSTQQGGCDEVISSESLSRLYGYPLARGRRQGAALVHAGVAGQSEVAPGFAGESLTLARWPTLPILAPRLSRLFAPVHVGIGILNQGLDVLSILRVHCQTDCGTRRCPSRDGRSPQRRVRAVARGCCERFRRRGDYGPHRA
jgi:hypothetical protein